MHGDDSEPAVLANEYSRRRTIERVRRMDDGRKTLSGVTPSDSVKRWRGIEPAAARGVKEPAAIVVRSPAPRLEAGKSPAETRIPDPLAHGERRPAEACAKGAPSVAIASTGRPRAVGVEIGVAWQIIGRARVLKSGVRCAGNRIDSAGDPVIEIIVGGQTADVHGILAGLHRERLTLAKLRGFFFVQNRSVASQNVDVAAIVKIIDAEGAF